MEKPTSATPVTTDPQLNASFAPLLNLPPHVERDGNKIIISNLPTNASYDAIARSEIIKICHQMKHLYSDGDRVGRKGIAKKRAGKERLENNAVRMCITYTFSLRKETESGTTTMIIDFVTSFAKNHMPRFICRYRKSELSSKELEEMKNNEEVIASNNRYIIVERNMSEAEVTDQMDIFISTCYEEISEYFRKSIEQEFKAITRRIAPLNGIEPSERSRILAGA